MNSVLLCPIESQTKTFKEKQAAMKPMDSVQVEKYEENMDGSEFDMGLRSEAQGKAKDSD
eukprot:CAMPEP_0176348092 /NCGR_PEP_ID=MMETSP0126-20121128/7590_1 /TAXON_ID=141414 ORGANISM="Strombidinopsis acuminatum, Strain SPMC142" /NCGR_SAMPLE_ID=MMETSP0126 /ASSEMBLY_ACC=CAM_ASM_000229 /LENGTH=59 /DNA_ID=CAMNT_0017696679 /DNA_START=130 /DNA_END=309 /DNA_ORIENTATION=+